MHEILSTSNGLASKTVYNILQDKNGFIWIGHEKGISRYDGKKIKTLLPITTQGKSCTSLQESKDGRIWFVNFDGNVFYTDAKSDTIYEELKLKTTQNWSPIFYVDNCILKPTENKILCLNLANNKLTIFSNPFKAFSFKDVDLQNGELLIDYFNDSTICAFTTFKRGQFRIIYKSQNLGNNNIVQSAGMIKALGQYWLIQNKHGISFLNIKTGQTKKGINCDHTIIINHQCWVNNNLWLCTTNGLYSFDANLNPLMEGKALFPKYSITNIISDKENIVWISTLNGGIIKVPSIDILTHKFNEQSITALTSCAEAHTLIIGSEQNQIIKWNIKFENPIPIFNNHSNKAIENIAFNKYTNELLFSSDRSYVLNLNSNTHSVLKAYCKDFDVIDKQHYAIASPYGYGFNKAFHNSLSNNEEDAINKYGYLAVQNKFVRTRCVAYDAINKILYAGTINGLFQFKDSINEEIKINTNSIIASKLILFNNTLYVGSLNNGLLLIKNKKIESSFSIKNGLLSNNILKLKTFNNLLWILTDKGLQTYNPNLNNFLNYTFSEIFANNEITDFEVMDNKIFLASESGIIEVPIQSNIPPNYKPLIWIDKFYCDKVSYKFNESQIFKSGNHLIEIFLTLPNFRNTNQLIIYYQVNQSNWQKLANGEQGLTLPQLSSGKYKIRFKAECNGLVSAEFPEVNFTIDTAWYMSWWFVIASILLLLSISIFVIKNEFKKQRAKQEFETQKNKLEKELQQSTLASIKSQMNPHFLFNALNTIQSYIYQNDKQNASQYLGKFSELTRMILEMSNRETIPLSEEIKALKLYLELEQLRFEEKLKYEIVVAQNIDVEMIHIPSMLIQPYIENAIKHGLLHKKDNWILEISFEKNEKILVVIVDDNGIGRKRSQELQKLKLKQHQSFAMSANEKRLDILNKGLEKPIALQIIDKTNENSEAIGTTVILNIPILSSNRTIDWVK